MFCVNCGTPILEGQNFCRNCGQPVKRPAAAAVAAPPAAVPPALATPVVAAGRCNWCGADVDLSQPACPRCGAALKPPAAAHSGWTKLPARKDMAKLQIGNSSCQIEGVYVPVADMNLAAGDSVYFTHHVLLWKDPQVNVTTMSLKGAWKRMFAGLPLIMTQAEGPGHIAFSKDDPGELIPLPMQPGRSIDVREHMLLAATSNVTYDWFQTGIWFETQRRRRHRDSLSRGLLHGPFHGPAYSRPAAAARRRQCLHARTGVRADDPGEADGPGLQGSHGPDAASLRAPRRRLHHVAQLGESLSLAAPHRTRAAWAFSRSSIASRANRAI